MNRVCKAVIAAVLAVGFLTAPILTVPAPMVQTAARMEWNASSADEGLSLEHFGRIAAAVAESLGPRGAEGAVPVKRIDSFWEKIWNWIQQAFTDYIKSFITSLTDIHSLGDLLALKDKLQNLVKNFNIGNLLNEIMNVALGELQNILSDVISQSLTDVLDKVFSGSGLEGLGIDGKSIANAISGALRTGNFKGAAQGLLSSFQGALEGKVVGFLKDEFKKIDLGGKFKDVPSAKPGGGGTGAGTPYDPPEMTDGGPSGGHAYDPNNDPDAGDGSEVANPGMTKEEISEASERAAGAANVAIQDFAKTYPMSLPSAQSQTAVMTVQTLADSANRDLFAMHLAEQAKTPIISKVVSLTAKYKPQGEGKKSAFDEMLDKYAQANQDLAKRAGESFSGGGDGDALRYIAGLMGVQVQQTALMNNILISMNRVLADEISLLEQVAYLGIEPYAHSIANQINAYGMAYGKMTNVIE